MGLLDFFSRKPKSHYSPEFQLLLEQSMNELRLKTEAHNSIFQLGKARWDVDQNAGTIIFTTPEMTATCPVQFFGTRSTADDSWLWAWSNPSMQPTLTEHALTAKTYGEQHNIDRLFTPKFNCTEQEAWELSALACKLSEAQGVYRGPAGPTHVFMTFGKIQLTKTP